MSIDEPFENYATQYDAWYDSERGKIVYENEKRCLKRIINDCKGKVLEVGVGTGRFAVIAEEAFGVDVARAPLRIAKSRGIKVIQAKAEELPFRDKAFCCVMFIVTLCFVKKPLLALSEANRVLKDKGKIIIGDVFLDSEWGRFYEQKKREGHVFYRFAKFYSFEDFRKIVNSAGLRIKRVFGSLKKSPFEEPSPEEPEAVSYEVSSYGFLCVELTK
ncbi:class I SAM-dependent methyltransferase [Thermodesulfovibrio yellowstonii]|uniref:SAM-dependent methyltransferase n=1 Tax=Thermodesulfovibrio yellowstonii TaxID=28262 RepID=A0A9W6LJK1_9BACT|nr:class I SAM-dependent methyltransferase [Thermodesulfovibrio islandicus]GLI52772.1 SAM-dependent methyltransferase [Thermodesulfovibrio islandicus]